jgi:hypothetical protein
MANFLTSRQVKQFKRDGVIVIPNFYKEQEIVQIQRGIYGVIGQIMKKNDVADIRSPFSALTFDDGYLSLIKQNRAWGGEVYDAIKQIPAFFRLVSHPSHEAILAELRPGALAGIAAGGYGIRIDNPLEDTYRAMWHQEYPAQLRSLDGLVFWSPLVSVSEDMGPPVFCLGSHAEGPLPVCEADPKKVARSGAYALQIYNEGHYLDKYDKAAPLTNPRDLVIIDFLVLHASGYNHSDRPRWSMQFRYFNFAEATGRSHAWRGSYAAGEDFRKVHPELFVG